MERKIGEIFKYNGEWYQCLKSPDGTCTHCDMNFGGKCPIPIKECVASSRSDLSYVIFKKLEKVGEPYVDCGTILQRFKIYTNVTDADTKGLELHIYSNNTIGIEIKQTKEDMEEREYSEEEFKNNPRFQHHKNIEQVINMKKMKEFDINLAKQGKPVCTRDGRKARIICFDRISGDDYYKIVACVTAFDGDFEEVIVYGIDGYIVDSQNPKDEDLMMLPEKKEGWVNIYRSQIYNTLEKAKEAYKISGNDDNYLQTIKIEWEE